MFSHSPANVLLACLLLVSCAGQQRSSNTWSSYDYGNSGRARDYDADYTLPAPRSAGCVDDAPGCF